jgi:hypothetical protein
MKLNKLNTVITALAVATMFELLGSVKPADAATTRLFGLTNNNTIISIDPSKPNDTGSFGVTGINGTLLGIDVRSADGLLYGFTDTNDIYTIDPTTGAATFVSTLSVPFDGGVATGVDFNPAADRLRLVDINDQNFRLNVDNGAVADFDPNTPGIQPDAPLAYGAGDPNSGADPNITAAAYTNAFAGPPTPAGVTPPTRTTQLFGIDSALDVLVLQNPPNNGTLTTIGSLGIDFGSTGGFDIFSPSAGVNTAYAASGSNLYTIDLATGSATTIGPIGEGNVEIIGLASTSVPEPDHVGSLIGFSALALAGCFHRRIRLGS